MKTYKNHTLPEHAQKAGYIPVAGPFRPSEHNLLFNALHELRSADCLLVVEPSQPREAFIGISIYRHQRECHLCA